MNQSQPRNALRSFCANSNQSQPRNALRSFCANSKLKIQFFLKHKVDTEDSWKALLYEIKQFFTTHLFSERRFFIGCELAGSWIFGILLQRGSDWDVDWNKVGSRNPDWRWETKYSGDLNSKSWRSGVLTLDSSSRRILNVRDLSWVKARGSGVV